MTFFDYDKFDRFVCEASDYYEKSAPTVEAYLDDLYRRVNSGKPVQLREILTISKLWEEGIWLQPNYAANLIYHLMYSIGLDTSGQAGF